MKTEAEAAAAVIKRERTQQVCVVCFFVVRVKVSEKGLGRT